MSGLTMLLSPKGLWFYEFSLAEVKTRRACGIADANAMRSAASVSCSSCLLTVELGFSSFLPMERA